MKTAEEKRASAAYIAKHGRIRPSHAVRNDAVLATAMISVIAESGWDETSVNRVAKAAGLTNGAVHSRFADKGALGAHAWDTHLRAPLTEALATVITAGPAADASSPATAAQTLAPFAAATWREYLAPDVAGRRIVGIETDRLSWYDARMREVTFAADTAVLDGILAGVPKAARPEMTGYVHLEFASGHGLPVIGALLPDSWKLPFDVVTVPHTASEPSPA